MCSEWFCKKVKNNVIFDVVTKETIAQEDWIETGCIFSFDVINGLLL